MLSLTTAISGAGRRDLIAGIVVAVIAFLVYANSLANGFVWDDSAVIVSHPSLEGSSLSLFGAIDRARDASLTPYYRPLALLSFLIEEQVHGRTPMLMHLLNVLLHAVNAFLVHRLGRLLTGDGRVALLAGLLFAVHPVHAESVNFLSGGRNTMLAALFLLGSYLVHAWTIRQDNIRGAIAGAGLFLAGLLSKETAIAILPFIIALEVEHVRGDGRVSLKRTVVRLMPYAAVTVVYFVLRFNALSGAGVNINILPGLGARLLDNIYIVPRYLLSVVWPTSISSVYFVPEDLHLLALPLAAAWIIIVGALGWLVTRGRSRMTVFGLFWLAAFWLPVSGVIPIPSAALADRYFYVPAIGLWLVASDQAVRLLSAGDGLRRSATIATGVLLAMLAIMTVSRNAVWRTDIALFTDVVDRHPDRAFGHHNLGCAYLDTAGDLDRAERSFDTALAIDPAFPRLRTQMGYVRLLRGDYHGALLHYEAALQIDPFDREALLNRGVALDRLGRRDEALTAYRRFLATPGNELAGARPGAEARMRELSR